MQIIYNSGMKKYYEGTISCKAILENPQRTCTCLYIDKKKRNREFRYIINLAKKQGCPVRFLERKEMDALTDNQRYGGILLEAQSLDKRKLAHAQGFLAYVDGVEDPYNLGSVCRSLYASGCDGLILPNRDWSKSETTILKASAGAYEKLPIYWIDLEQELVTYLQENHIPLYCAYRNHAKSLTDWQFPHSFCVAIGGALRGLSATVLQASSQNLVIEYGRDFRNALDTPSAVAVIAFEILRQQSE